ncbi:MAG: tRNA guanosine(34) transglycosylase Tgt [Chloroflexi bacterium]|nr:tRNA guanosine(34) transglycosylase Tgt [Chloroflexota bacterium]
MPLTFDIQSRDPQTRARAGVLHTAHGDIETPNFMAVATQASVKALTPDDLESIGLQLLIANTYHLALRPGADKVAQLGGLHAFMNWQRPLMTDSGGFQVFSLGAAIRDGVGKIADIFPEEQTADEQGRRGAQGKLAPAPPLPRSLSQKTGIPLCRIDDDGVTFRSHLDGAIMRLDPERSLQIQHQLGADFVVAFDECTSPLDSPEYTREALQRTHRWAERSLEQHHKTRREYQSLFGIVQGGAYRDLREESARVIGGLPFDGLCIGGSLGKSKKEMHAILDWTIPFLPDDKPRHLLGIGELQDIIAGVARGIDLFDCASPTRWARNGALIVSHEIATNAEQRITISNARFAMDTSPIDPTCDCYACQHFTRAYLHHLHRAKELIYYRLASLHNLRMMMRFMREVRDAIRAGTFDEFNTNHASPNG